MQIFAATERGKVLAEGGGRDPGIDRQPMIQVVVAQEIDDGPVLIAENDTFALGQGPGFVSGPGLVGQFGKTFSHIEASGLGVLWIARELFHDYILMVNTRYIL